MAPDSDEKKTRLIKLFRANFTLAMGVIALTGILLLLGALLIPTSTIFAYHVLRQALAEIGIAIFAGATVSVILSEYYRKFRELSTHAELSWMLVQLTDIIRDPSELFDLQALISLKKANVLTFYHDRTGPAELDMRSKLESLLGTSEETEVCILGNTLRVFFHPHTEFTDLIIRLVTEKRNIKFKVLLTNPNSLTAFYRSLAETPHGFKDDEDYWRKSAFIADSGRTRQQIEVFNLMAQAAYQCKRMDECKALDNKCKTIEECKAGEKHEAIRVRYYDCADTCLIVLYPDICYTSQYIYADDMTQIYTVGLPVIKYRGDCEQYKRLKRHFDYIWDISMEYAAVEKSKLERPVVKSLYAWKAVGSNNRFLPSGSSIELHAASREGVSIEPPIKQ